MSRRFAPAGGDELSGIPAASDGNVEKTHVTHAARGVKFLGVEIGTRWIRIQRKKVAAFKEKVKR
jgi:hypothetical protein